jgi:hypothetical protein
MELDQVIEDMVGKTIERVTVSSMIVTVHFTDGSEVEIAAHTTEEGHISVDGESR